MRVRAFAKINLSLRVLGTRPDGYHDLRTVFQSIALHDDLTFRRHRGPLALTCDAADCPAGRANLVWRAAAAVWKAADRAGAPRGVAIHLTKRIPMQAGLGGGSSDAAAAIRGCGRLWGVDRPVQRAIAATIGADVSYFLEGGTALGLDRGDRLFPLRDLRAAWVLVLIPPFGVSTRDAFRWFDARRPRRRRPIASDVDGPDWHNDLEDVVAARHGEISRLANVLRRAGAGHALMSGSGSAVVGLFAQRRTAVAAAARAEAGSPETRVVLTRTLGRAAYRRLARA
jgi:4-diphosphocytidyl-2-C-methyl-D-erythritol kinase